MRSSFPLALGFIIYMLIMSVVSIGWAQSEGRVLILKSSAYTSSPQETDGTPKITATGAQTRLGVIAVSPDLLSTDLPYGSIVKLDDLGNWKNGAGAGQFNGLLGSQLFVVEDTMNPRKRQQIDVWMPDRALALRFGVRRIQLTVVQYGRTPGGP